MIKYKINPKATRVFINISMIAVACILATSSVSLAQQSTQVSEEGIALLARLEGAEGTVAEIKKRLEYEKGHLEQQAQNQPSDPKAAHRARIMGRLSGHLRPGGRATASNMGSPIYRQAKQTWFHRINEDVAKLEDDIRVLRAALHKAGPRGIDAKKFNDDVEQLRQRANELAKRVDDEFGSGG